MKDKDQMKFLVLLTIFWIASSMFAAAALVSVIDIFSPLTTGIILYLLFSCSFGVFFLPKVIDFLFYGFVLFGGLTFCPFSLVLSVLIVFGINPFYSIFFSVVFPSLVSFYWLDNLREKKNRKVREEMSPETYSVILFAIAIVQTFGFIGVLTNGFADFVFLEAIVANLTSIQSLVLELLIAVLTTFVFAFFYGVFCTISGVFRSGLRLSEKILRETFVLLPMLCVFFGGYMIPSSIFLFASGSKPPFPDIVQTVGMVFLISAVVIGAGFYQMIIATTALGFKSKKERKKFYLFKNLMFAFCLTFSIALFILGKERKILDLPIIQLAFVTLILYEFFEEIGQNSVFYESISQRLRVPINLLKVAQAMVMVFVPFLAEPTDVYMYLAVLPFWLLGIHSSYRGGRTPFTLKQFAESSEYIDHGQTPSTFEWLRRQDRKSFSTLSSLANRIYSAVLAGFCVGILHVFNKMMKLQMAVPIYYIIFFLAVPFYFLFKQILQSRARMHGN